MSDELNNKLLEINNFGFSKEDFTDDANYPTVNRLIKLMDQLYHMVKRREATLGKELDKLVMSENRSDKALANRVWKHRLITEDPLGEFFT